MKTFCTRVFLFLFITLMVITSRSFATDITVSKETIAAISVIVSMTACCKTEAWPEAEHLLERELKTLGLRVYVVDSQAQDEPSRRLELAEFTRHYRAACAIRVVRPADDAGRVELWVEDRVTHKMLFRQLRMDSDTMQRSAEIVALRAVEMLRASLLELQMEDASGSPKRDLPRPVMNLASATLHRPALWDLSLLGGIWFSSGGAPPLLQMQLGVAVRFVQNWILSVTGGFSPVSSEIRDRGMSASFQIGDTFLWGFWEPSSVFTTTQVKPALGVGAGGLFVHTQGTSSLQGAINQTDTAFVSTAAIRFDVRFGVGSWANILASVVAGFAFPEITVLFSERIVATVGNPFAQMLIGVEMHLF